MEVYEKINLLLQEKGISKRDFVMRLRNLEPRLKSGEIPSEQTIYRYLNNTREIKIELIPYIAEALDVSEQELFSFDIEYASNYNYKQSKEIREIIELMQYVPSSIVEHIKNHLHKYKQLHQETLQKI